MAIKNSRPLRTKIIAVVFVLLFASAGVYTLVHSHAQGENNNFGCIGDPFIEDSSDCPMVVGRTSWLWDTITPISSTQMKVQIHANLSNWAFSAAGTSPLFFEMTSYQIYDPNNYVDQYAYVGDKLVANDSVNMYRRPIHCVDVTALRGKTNAIIESFVFRTTPNDTHFSSSWTAATFKTWCPNPPMGSSNHEVAQSWETAHGPALVPAAGTRNVTTGTNDGQQNGKTGTGTGGGSSAGSTATKQGNKSNTTPSSSSQGTKNQTKLDPSPFFDGKQYAPGSDPLDKTFGNIFVGSRSIAHGWIYIIAVLLVLLAGIAYYVLKVRKRRR